MSTRKTQFHCLFVFSATAVMNISAKRTSFWQYEGKWACNLPFQKTFLVATDISEKEICQNIPSSVKFETRICKQVLHLGPFFFGSYLKIFSSTVFMEYFMKTGKERLRKLRYSLAKYLVEVKNLIQSAVLNWQRSGRCFVINTA